MTNPYLLFISCYSYRRSLLINQWSIVFNKMSVEDSTSFFSSSIFSWSHVFVRWHLINFEKFLLFKNLYPHIYIIYYLCCRANKWECVERSMTAFAFFLNKAEIDLDSTWYTQLNSIVAFTPIFSNALWGTSIILAFDWR